MGLPTQTPKTDGSNESADHDKKARTVSIYDDAGVYARESAPDRRQRGAERELPHLPAQIFDDGLEEYARGGLARSHPGEEAYDRAPDHPPAVEGLPSLQFSVFSSQFFVFSWRESHKSRYLAVYWQAMGVSNLITPILTFPRRGGRDYCNRLLVVSPR